MSQFTDVIDDMVLRRIELSRRRGVIDGEMSALDVAIDALRKIQGAEGVPVTRLDAIKACLQVSEKWLTHAEIVRSVVPGDGRTPQLNRQRHSARTQIGQMVTQGQLKQVGQLIGLPHWTEPDVTTFNPEPVSTTRNGRAQNIRDVLREAGHPLHIKDVCAELIRRNLDADERCVAAAIHSMLRRPSGHIRRIGPAIIEFSGNGASQGAL